MLHALRGELGDDAFFTLLQRWVAENNGTSRTTADFIALAEDVAGRALTDSSTTGSTRLASPPSTRAEPGGQ